MAKSFFKKTSELDDEENPSAVMDGFIAVTIDDIECNNKNPRRARNPNYESIKESIRNIGLQQPVVLTKRPDEEFYIPYNGGNTRISVLKELYAETGDDRFYSFTFQFVEYKDETSILISHMLENDNDTVRGEMRLVDKALAVKEIFTLHEEKIGKKASVAKIEELLKSGGLPYSKTLISIFRFVADELADVLPLALENGLGRPSIEKIRKSFHSFSPYIKSLQDKQLDEFQNLSDADKANVKKEWSEKLRNIQDEYLILLSEEDTDDGFDVNISIDKAIDATCFVISDMLGKEANEVKHNIFHCLKHGDVPKLRDESHDMPRLEKTDNENMDAGFEKQAGQDGISEKKPVEAEPINDGDSEIEDFDATKNVEDVYKLVVSQIRVVIDSLRVNYPNDFGRFIQHADSYPFVDINSSVLKDVKKLAITRSDSDFNDLHSMISFGFCTELLLAVSTGLDEVQLFPNDDVADDVMTLCDEIMDTDYVKDALITLRMFEVNVVRYYSKQEFRKGYDIFDALHGEISKLRKNYIQFSKFLLDNEKDIVGIISKKS